MPFVFIEDIVAILLKPNLYIWSYIYLFYRGQASHAQRNET